MTIQIKNAIQWRYTSLTLKQVYFKGSKGVNSNSPEWGVRRGMLQRKIQQEEWKKNQNKRVKDYLTALIKGCADVDSFMIARLDLVIASLIKRLNYTVDKSEKKTIEVTIELTKKDKENGVEFYILDGQNRLFEAIIPFINNKITLSEEPLYALDESNNEIPLAGKLYKSLPKDVQEFLDNKRIPIHQAVEGDISELIDSLIAKNSGVTWTPWQMLLTQNTFTLFRSQILDVVEDNFIVDKVLSKINKTDYKYEKDGYELFVSELLIWMKTFSQPDNTYKMQNQFFTGDNGNVVSDTMVSSLKKYLREFAQLNTKTVKITHIIIRNYIMLRYAIDNPKKFKLSIPSWKINKSVEFVSQFIIKNKAAYDDEGAYQVYKDDKGNVIKRDKVPGYLPYANSGSDKKLLQERIRILLTHLKNQEDELVDNNVITIIDNSKMPHIIDVAKNNDMKDYQGNELIGVEILSGDFDRGHVTPKSKGGSNQNLKLQPSKSNKQYGANGL